MSLQSIAGNIASAAGNTVQSLTAVAEGALSNAVGTISTAAGNIWSGGFAGISKEGIENELIPAINAYCERIESQISSFNADGDLTAAFAGTELVTNAQYYVKAVKEVLKAYVNTMRLEINSANTAFEAWSSGTANVAASASSSASDLRSVAKGLSLD